MARLTKFRWFSHFGVNLRLHRHNKGIGLRKFAAMIPISPAYLCRIELGQINPPGEPKIRRIAALLDGDPDEWLAAAGRLSSDLVDIIISDPRNYGRIIRTLAGMEPARRVAAFDLIR
jgi:transcriptional regulator with XRE-family HTH domain